MAHETYRGSSFNDAQYHAPYQPIGLGIQFHGYEQQLHGYYPSDGHRSQTSSPYMPSQLISSPPTPKSHPSDSRRIRSGHSTIRNDSPHSSHQPSPPPARATRKKKASSEKNKTPKLTAPLSVLTKDMKNVPVRDMEKWVNRSVEERLKEAEKRNGYITRPMNSFMLYRSAYAERTKQWCLHNNHQVVSSVSGESWPLEPPEVREFYNELAKLERTNHQHAHPAYKFSPSKPGVVAGASKKRKADSDDESEPSDLDDPDWAMVNGIRHRPTKRLGIDAGYPARANIEEVAHRSFHEPYNRASWDPQPVRPPPTQVMPYPQMPQHAQSFYPSPSMQHQHLQMLPPQPETFVPAFDLNDFNSTHSLIGLPGQSHNELFGLTPNGPQTPMLEQQYDPELLAYHGDHQYQVMGVEGNLMLTQQHGDYGPGFSTQLGEHHTTPSMQMFPTPSEIAGPLITDYRPKEWHPESQSPTFDHGATEFDQLWDEHESQRERCSIVAGRMRVFDDGSKSPKTQ